MQYISWKYNEQYGYLIFKVTIMLLTLEDQSFTICM
jgi:hypothetical protein